MIAFNSVTSSVILLSIFFATVFVDRRLRLQGWGALRSRIQIRKLAILVLLQAMLVARNVPEQGKQTLVLEAPNQREISIFGSTNTSLKGGAVGRAKRSIHFISYVHLYGYCLRGYTDEPKLTTRCQLPDPLPYMWSIHNVRGVNDEQMGFLEDFADRVKEMNKSPEGRALKESYWINTNIPRPGTDPAYYMPPFGPQWKKHGKGLPNEDGHDHMGYLRKVLELARKVDLNGKFKFVGDMNKAIDATQFYETVKDVTKTKPEIKCRQSPDEASTGQVDNSFNKVIKEVKFCFDETYTFVNCRHEWHDTCGSGADKNVVLLTGTNYPDPPTYFVPA